MPKMMFRLLSRESAMTTDPESARVNCPHCFTLYSITRTARLRGILRYRFQCCACEMRGPHFDPILHGEEAARLALQSFRALWGAP